jgi:hypothetical protein
MVWVVPFPRWVAAVALQRKKNLISILEKIPVKFKFLGNSTGVSNIIQ